MWLSIFLIIGSWLKINERKVKVWGGFGKRCNNDTQWQMQNRIFDSDGICPALTTWCVYWVLIREDDGDDK